MSGLNISLQKAHEQVCTIGGCVSHWSFRHRNYIHIYPSIVGQQGCFFVSGVIRVLGYRQDIKMLGCGVLAFSILLVAYYGFSFILVLGSLLICHYLISLVPCLPEHALLSFCNCFHSVFRLYSAVLLFWTLPWFPKTLGCFLSVEVYRGIVSPMEAFWLLSWFAYTGEGIALCYS